MRLANFFCAALVFLGLSSPIYADELADNLNTITFETAADGWVPIWTARVSVEYTASLSEQQLGKFHNDILVQLAKIIDSGKWNVTNFERNGMTSGLQNVRVIAITRVPFSSLAQVQLREKAQAISSPEQTFKIVSVEYVPTLADRELVRQSLRDRIYSIARAEADRVNKIFPGSHYYVHNVTFAPITIQQYDPTVMAMSSLKRSDSEELLQPKTTVSELLTVQARVTLATQSNLVDIPTSVATGAKSSADRVIVRQ